MKLKSRYEREKEAAMNEIKRSRKTTKHRKKNEEKIEKKGKNSFIFN
jgi:hypothetical protein